MTSRVYAEKPSGGCASEEEQICKTALLGILGKNLAGSALGVLVAKFILWCRENNYSPFLDFRGVETIGESFVESALLHYEDYYDTCDRGAVKVEFRIDDRMRSKDAVTFLCSSLSSPPIRSSHPKYD